MPTVFSTCIFLATVLASVSMTASATRCTTGSLLEGTVVEISSSKGGMDGKLGDGDRFGRSVAGVGDVDRNGAVDMVVGASLDDDDGTTTTVEDVGAVYLLLMEEDGSSVKKPIKISSYTTGKFTSNKSDQFGRSVAGGVDAKGESFDVDNDGMWDLVVSARRGDGDGVANCGAVYVLFMNPKEDYTIIDAGVRAVKKISHGEGGLGYALSTGDTFGTSVAVVGTDVNNRMIAVGAAFSFEEQGAVYVLGLDTDGSVNTEKLIALGQGGLQAVLEAGDRFGQAMTATDLTGDGINELVVSAQNSNDGYENAGAVYVLSLDSQGGVVSEKKISATTQNYLMLASLKTGDLFGSALTELGDLDMDGVVDLAVGAHGDNDGGNNQGAVYVLLLNSDGGVKAYGKVSATAGGFDGGPLDVGENFGSGLAKLGERSADGVLKLAVGARKDDGSGSQRGAVYVLEVPSWFVIYVNPCASDEQCMTSGGATSFYCVPALNMCDSGGLGSELKIASGESGFVGGSLSAHDGFGRAVVCLGDVDKDGVLDMAVGAPFDDDGGVDRGAVYILFMKSDGNVKGERKISSLPAGVESNDRFGPSVAALGDLDEDGVVDLAVGSVMDDDGGIDRGAVYILFLNTDGSAKGQSKISSIQGGLVGLNDDRAYFGASLAAVGDLDKDEVMDLAVGAIGGGGAVYILFLKKDGSVGGNQKISSTEGGLMGPVTDYFGGSVAGMGDLDQDGVLDLAVGVISDTDGGVGAHGAVYILFLHENGSVRTQQKISATQGGMQSLGTAAWFGSAVTSIGDLDGDGVTDLAVGARKFNDPEGGVVILLLKLDGTVKAQQVISSSQGGLLSSLDGAQLGMGLSVWGDGVLNAKGMVDLAVGAPYRSGDGAGAVYVLGVPPGFVPVCQEACDAIIGDDGTSSYTCNCTTPGYELDEDDDRTCVDINECDDETTKLCDEKNCINIDGGYTCD